MDFIIFQNDLHIGCTSGANEMFVGQLAVIGGDHRVIEWAVNYET